MDGWIDDGWVDRPAATQCSRGRGLECIAHVRMIPLQQLWGKSGNTTERASGSVQESGNGAGLSEEDGNAVAEVLATM